MKTLHVTPKTFLLFIAVLLSSAITKAQTPDDTEFQKSLDLVGYYLAPSEYIDSTRSIIRTEGESVIYQTEIKFPGAIENYLETYNNNGKFRAVFYRGNDKAAAENKYNEIAAITKRLIKGNDAPSPESYCYECSGLGFGFWGTYLWVQKVNKPNGIYEVQLIHNIKLNKYYFPKAGNAPAVATADFPVGAKVKVFGMPITDPNNSFYYSDETMDITGVVIETDLKKDANGKYDGCIKDHPEFAELYRERVCFTGKRVELVK